MSEQNPQPNPPPASPQQPALNLDAMHTLRNQLGHIEAGAAEPSPAVIREQSEKRSSQ